MIQKTDLTDRYFNIFTRGKQLTLGIYRHKGQDSGFFFFVLKVSAN